MEVGEHVGDPMGVDLMIVHGSDYDSSMWSPAMLKNMVDIIMAKSCILWCVSQFSMITSTRHAQWHVYQVCFRLHDVGNHGPHPKHSPFTWLGGREWQLT